MKDRFNVKNPSDIERLSFEVIEREVPEPRPFKGDEWRIVRRMIHASADFELLELVRFHPLAIESGKKAIRSGCLIVTDTEMLRAGIRKKALERFGVSVECHINDRNVVEMAREKGITRAGCAVDIVGGRINGGIYAIGNAPTSLNRLLDLVNEKSVRPALIIGMPVGFVNAEESKERLMSQDLIPYICIKGRKGGSPLAASVINELILMP